VLVSKRVAIVAAGIFLALFAAVCFLLGRESSRRRTLPAVSSPTPDSTASAAAPVSPAIAAVNPAAPATIAAAPPPMVQLAPAPPPPVRAALPSTPPLPPIGAGGGPAGPDSSEAAAARDYFARMQAIQTISPTNDASELANRLLATAMNGDMSGFDDLVKTAEAGAERARAVTPPACCVEYHRRMLAMLGESVAMVGELKTAIKSNDAAALTALAASGSSLQSRANALEDEARQIKARLGLAR
jgi:hypothetical protein